MTRYLPILLVLLALAFGWSMHPTTSSAIPLEKPAPDIAGEHWINSKPLGIKALRGRVVLIEFWTYG